MENTKNLQVALKHFDEFYKNVNDIIKLNDKESKKLFGHFLFKKSDDVLFNFIETSLLNIGSILGCAYLKKNDLLPYDFYLTAGISCFATSALAVIINNLLYHINHHIGGPIGRTYAQMESDYYFNSIQYYIKKKYKDLLNDNTPVDKKITKFIEFATTLENISNNLLIDYDKICKRVEKYSSGEQLKWKPILEHIEEYSLYLQNNAEKFSTYAQTLKDESSKYFICNEDGHLANLMISRDKQHSSSFYQFKEYLANKKIFESINNINNYYSKLDNFIYNIEDKTL